MNIMVKGQFEFFNGENRMRFFAVKVFPHNVQAENRALTKRLELYKILSQMSGATEDAEMAEQSRCEVEADDRMFV